MILKPVLNFVANILSKVLTAVFETILVPILQFVFQTVFKWLWDLIVAALGGLLYRLFTMMLWVSDLIFSVLDIMMGVKEVYSPQLQRNASLMEAFFSISGIKTTFLLLTVAAVALMAMFTAYSSMRATTSLCDPRTGHTPAKAVRMLGRSLFTLLSGPILVVVLMFMTVTLASVTRDLVVRSSIDSGSPTFGSAVFVSATMDAAQDSAYNGNSASALDNVRKPFYSGARDYTDKDAVEKSFKINKINYLLGIPSAFLLLISAISLGFSVIRRLLDVIILYLIMPFFASSIALDDGKRCEKWKGMMVGRMFIANGTYLSVLVSVYIFLPWIMGTKFNTGSSTLDFALRILLLLAVITNCSKFPKLAAGLFDYSAAASDIEDDQLVRTTIPGGNIMG